MSTQTTKSTGCSNCAKFEAQYKQNPRSLKLLLWHWHTGWCPGYKAQRQAQKAVANAPKK
jgi:hypothetical protein